jgi:dihydropteroate synthase
MRDPVATIVKELEAAVSRARGVGIDKSRLVIDPGFGFGKRKEQNSLILDRLGELRRWICRFWPGPSRKSFLTHPSPEETSYATAAAVAACILRGAHIVRVHDVRACARRPMWRTRFC